MMNYIDMLFSTQCSLLVSILKLFHMSALSLDNETLFFLYC